MGCSSSDLQFALLIAYTLAGALLMPLITVCPTAHVLLWRVLRPLSRTKFIVRHFVKNYYYQPENEARAATLGAQRGCWKGTGSERSGRRCSGRTGENNALGHVVTIQDGMELRNEGEFVTLRSLEYI